MIERSCPAIKELRELLSNPTVAVVVESMLSVLLLVTTIPVYVQNQREIIEIIMVSRQFFRSDICLPQKVYDFHVFRYHSFRLITLTPIIVEIESSYDTLLNVGVWMLAPHRLPGRCRILSYVFSDDFTSY